MAPNQTLIEFPCRKQSVRRKIMGSDQNDVVVTCTSPAKSPCKDERPAEVRTTRTRLRVPATASPLKVLKDEAASPRRSPRKRLGEVSEPESCPSPRKTPRKNDENSDGLQPSPKKGRSCESKFVRARRALNTAAPQTICCRDEELATVSSFLREHIEGAKPGSMYISGRPGTGKTACVTHLLAHNDYAGRFKSIFINCMTLRQPGQVYERIAQQLDPKRWPSDGDCRTFLESHLTQRGPTIVLVLDEIDQMATRDQSVLYALFELPALAGSRLVLVGLANSLDLTDRALIRLQSRVHFKPQLLNFKPYTKQQIAQILSQRLRDAAGGDAEEAGAVVAPSALQYLGGKISASSGDLRKAIDVCRRAVELAETAAKKQHTQSVLTAANGTAPARAAVNIPMLCTLINDAEGSRFCSTSATASVDEADETPLQQRILIVSLLVLVKHGKSKQVTLGQLHRTYAKVCAKFRVTAMPFDELVHTCSLVEARGIVTVKKKADARLAPVALRLDEREVEHTLKDKTLLSSILSEGSSLV